MDYSQSAMYEPFIAASTGFSTGFIRISGRVELDKVFTGPEKKGKSFPRNAVPVVIYVSSHAKYYGLKSDGRSSLFLQDKNIAEMATFGVFSATLLTFDGDEIDYVFVRGIRFGLWYDLNAFEVWRFGQTYPGMISEEALTDEVEYAVTATGLFVWRINGRKMMLEDAHHEIFPFGQFSGVDVMQAMQCR